MESVTLILLLLVATVVAVMAIILVGVLRILGGLHERVEALAGQPRLHAGHQLEDRTFETLTGQTARLAKLWSHGTLLLFLTKVGCVPCRDVLRSLAAMVDADGGDWTACVLAAGESRLVAHLAIDAALPAAVNVCAVDPAELARLYPIAETPTVLVVKHDGVIDSILTNPSRAQLGAALT